MAWTIMLLLTAIIVWAGGGAAVAAAARLFGTPENNLTLAISYLAITAGVVIVAVYGYKLLLRVATVLAVGCGLALALMLVAFAGRVDLGYRGGGEYLLGNFWPTWLLSVVAIGIAGTLQICTLPGDWSRYVDPRRYSSWQLLRAAWSAIFVSFVIIPALGTLVATAFRAPGGDFPTSLVAASPRWYVWLLLPYAIIGTLALAAETVYSAGLDLDASVRRLSRPVATGLVSAAVLVLVFAGSVVWDAAASILAATLILLAVSAPWAAVVGVGYLRCRGRYDVEALQVWQRGQTGGRYRYSGGFNWRAISAWAAGTTWGLLAINAPLLVGPFANLAGGVDVSLLPSLGIAAGLYWALEAASKRTSVAVATHAEG
jgi:purine-cytosine permease-like protein